MAKETRHITRYYDAVPPYCSALKISERKYESDTDKDHDVSYSKEHFELESSNPGDTVKVATFLRNKQYKPNENIKKDHYYVCEFTWQPYRKIKEYKNSEDITYEGEDLMGRVLQHEYDHLKGKLLLSSLSRKERKEAIKKIALNGFPGNDL